MKPLNLHADFQTPLGSFEFGPKQSYDSLKVRQPALYV
ncbi:hypothetical protein LEP1GSC103_0439 [Leptospira borgpetersenii serovar Javanica str. UI 09931]|uniref:Uncharacterized protein n=4 Tax=Leptospira borgpetersenii TaxID=174 RepID=M3HWZ0_LEPBO|nr:hypothetical protein LEP1GSC128_1504 [Leptospira borgpetersenii str. 200801926]EKQ92458.1 hypothetical protein LEP1GSC101_2849 [Leptospira borgpetersenii str. UI 09149]EMG02115.1 hypothetical protein LEP1GSC123_2714 [Leptospira borgpetersenii str. 200701203]EMN11329.1 hypothetical protein LEP1GSC055_0921 [Leptospira borgpetersenii str. Brem 307]EMN19207.1 hypothetical protein LEP1GSC056_1855 [Leptospira borgpetersenii str. Brem 328]ENO64004.1 hypothetical protein LEP1GSC191_1386 [Leptospira